MKRRVAERAEPIWLLLPRWLHQSAPATAKRGLRRPFLQDILRAQHSLFLHVRLHDDVFDGQSEDRRAVLWGDQFLMESERLFARHLRGAFWTLFRDAVTTTTSAILETDARQRRGRANRRSLDLYARVGEIFKVGASAVCLATGRSRLLPDVGGLLDELCVISQVFDDLQDVKEDRTRSRTNFAAAFARVDRVGRVTPRHVVALVAELRRRAARARVHAGRLNLPPAVSYVNQIAQSVDAFEAAVHRIRVEGAFGRRAVSRGGGVSAKWRRAPSGR